MIRRCWNRVSVKKKEKKRQRSEIYYFTDCYSRANRQPWAEISTTIRSELDGIHSVPKPHSLPRKIPIEKVHNSSGKSLSARKLRPHPPWRSNDWNSPFEWTGEEAARKYLSSFFSPFSTRLSLSLYFFPSYFLFPFFFPICSLLRYTGATRFTRVRSNDKQNETLCMPKTAISDTNVPVSRGEGRGYSDTKKIKRGGTVIEEALGNGVNG